MKLKKLIMYIMCILCVFGICNVKAQETLIPSLNPSNTENNNENNNENNIENENNNENNNENENNKEDENANNNENINDGENENTNNIEDKKEESTEVKQPAIQEEIKTNITTNTTKKESEPNASKKTTYSYTSKNTTKKSYKLTIYSVDLETKENLSGTKLQIQDEEGNIIYEWTSSNKEQVIDDLDEGSYNLVVVSNVEGYKAKKDKIAFTVDYDKEQMTLKVENTPTLDIIKVLNSNSILLISIAMVDMAIGIWIVIYVKKNKVKE